MEDVQQVNNNFFELTDDQKKAMTEDLILKGFCTYTFKIAGVPVVIKTLTIGEQGDLTRLLAGIPQKITDYSQGADGSLNTSERDISVAEYNTLTSQHVVLSQLVSFAGKSYATVEDLGNISAHVLKILALNIRKLNATVENVLLTVDNIKN